jgi:trimethylamine:corrinoid methyltransferase-like protein
VGVKFDPKSRALDPFSGAGCSISPDGIVRFPRDLVQQAIASAARSVKLWNRSGTDHIGFSDGNTIPMAGVTCLNVQDRAGRATGSGRPSRSSTGKSLSLLPACETTASVQLAA